MVGIEPEDLLSELNPPEMDMMASGVGREDMYKVRCPPDVDRAADAVVEEIAKGGKFNFTSAQITYV